MTRLRAFLCRLLCGGPKATPAIPQGRSLAALIADLEEEHIEPVPDTWRKRP